jgi:hypothetical protein
MTQETLKSLVEKLIEMLNMQISSFQENTLNKDCKSKIYERITTDEGRIAKIEDLVYGNKYSKGIFDRLEETNKVLDARINSMNCTLTTIAGILKEEEIRKKTISNLLKVVFSILGFVGISNILLLIKLLVK